MTDYRQLMLLLIEKRPYREIVARQGCSQRTIAKVRRVLDEQLLVSIEQVEALTLEDVDGLFSDGRKSVAGGFVPVNIDQVVQARLGRKRSSPVEWCNRFVILQGCGASFRCGRRCWRGDRSRRRSAAQ